VWVGERILSLDTMELGHIDYSIKPVKPIAHDESSVLENILLSSIIPIFYGAMPNLGLYFTSQGGQFPDYSALMNKGKFKESQEALYEAAQKLIEDIKYVSKVFSKSGTDGINLDTAAAAGDAEFFATLNAVEFISREIKIPVQIGMASEQVLGLHCELKYKGELLAGAYPHIQGKLAERAGATIFGPAINTKVSKSFPWNLARALTFVKRCIKDLKIPIHVNMGMGVGGIPMSDVAPMDSVSRGAKAMIEIARVDGI
jgi:dimethylamine--corrinoid protein Co-methyltransferase